MNRERRFIENNARILLLQQFLQLLAVFKVCCLDNTFHFDTVNVLEPSAFMLKNEDEQF